MKKNSKLSFGAQKEQLEKIIEEMDQADSFEQKSELYHKGIEIAESLETLLNIQQKVVSQIIKKD